MKKLAFILNIILISNLLADEGLNSAFNEAGNLTDQQVTQSREFVHEGIKKEIIEEGCKDLKNCQEPEEAGIEQIISKVYAASLPMIGQFKVGDKVSTPKAETSTAKPETPSTVTESASADNAPPSEPANTPKNEKKEDGNDWCMVMAIGFEVASFALQNKTQNKASKTDAQIPDTQLRSLVNLRETHKARKKSATYQAAAYGSVTACYAAMIAMDKLSMNWQTGVKMGGAALLTTLYMKKAGKHDKLAGKVQKVIDALPKSGECNPWTQSACFCQEASSKEHYPAEYQEVCVLNNGDFNTPKMAMGCAAQSSDGRVTYDEQCRCKQTNSCLSSKISAFNPTLSGATNLMKQMQSGFDLLDSGLYDEAKLNAYSTQAAAMGSKIAKQITNPDSQPIHLNNEQKKLAQELSGLVTPELAAKIASTSPDLPENSLAGARNMGGSSLSPAEIREEGLKAKGVTGKYKTGAVSRSSSKSESGFVMPNLLAKKSAPTSNIEVVNFAERAVNNADVNNSPDTPIFDIISNRYRHAWKRLE
ncbi:MAG TPA: hypothetical protein VKZ84_05995 [Bacteriovoracaceae bacterium]|nr:hypothetical protein [Bacteriovoracaceae bacterium]